MLSVERWNHNIHYHRLILDAIPETARTALDEGTGNGLLAAEMHQILPDVTGLDADAEVLESARREDPGVDWILGDVLTHPFAPASFDVVASVASGILSLAWPSSWRQAVCWPSWDWRGAPGPST